MALPGGAWLAVLVLGLFLVLPRSASETNRRHLNNWLWTRYSDPRYLEPRANQNACGATSNDVLEEAIDQKLDHLDPANKQVWTQTYFRNNVSYQAGGPAFVMLAGAGNYTNDWLCSSHMTDLAKKFGADTYFFTTRFYSAPYPTPDASPANLRFLNTEQIMQDIRALLLSLRTSGLLRAKQAVVLFGAGYGGSLASWFRQRFPDLVAGAVASSAITEARVEMSYYFPVVEHALSVLYDKPSSTSAVSECAYHAQEAYAGLEELLNNPEGRKRFNELLEPCMPLEEDPEKSATDQLDRAQALGYAASVLADVVQDNVDSREEYSLFAPCYMLQNDVPGATHVERLASLLKKDNMGYCIDLRFSAALEQASGTAWDHPHNIWGLRLWLWQQCTELGLFATATDSTVFPYTEQITMTYHRALCSGAFNVSFLDLVKKIRTIKSLYGGKKPNVTNTIFVNGDLDPWKGASPQQSYPGVTVFNVLRASHANDIFKLDMYDPPRLKGVRKRMALIIEKWLK